MYMQAKCIHNRYMKFYFINQLCTYTCTKKKNSRFLCAQLQLRQNFLAYVALWARQVNTLIIEVEIIKERNSSILETIQNLTFKFWTR